MPLRIHAMLLLLTALPALAGAGTYYVDPTNPDATDAGPGSMAIPYRTIQAAVTAFGLAGNTILVAPSTYRETVTLPNSGSVSLPIVLRALGAAIISGADDFGAPAQWSGVAGDVYLAAGVTWTPTQVLADGARLESSSATPSAIPPRSFRYVSGTGLYVNAGGGNPGAHACQVSRRNMAVVIHGRYVTVDGFTITTTNERAVEIESAANFSSIQNCTVSFAGKFGIHVTGSTDVTVERNVVLDSFDHGIFALSGSTRTRIAFNESARNARPAVRAANGIDIDTATHCWVEGNRCHDNQDSGIQFYNGSNFTVSRNNVSWNNGDHAFDQVRSTDCVHTHDVAYGNYKDGFSFEGDSPRGGVFNCISVDNGITTGQFDLWVDATSSAGFTSDYNLIWNSTSQTPFKFIATQYATIAAYRAASGQDAHSQQTNPLFAGSASGDFHLAAGSPAIDAANAGAPNWPAFDLEGQARFDDPAIPNGGTGSPPYADVGAYEYRVPTAVETSLDGPRFAAWVTPNPVRRDVAFHIATTGPGSVTVEVFDTHGRRVIAPVTLAFGAAGRHTIALPMRHALTAGIYFYRVIAAEGARSGRFVVLE